MRPVGKKHSECSACKRRRVILFLFISIPSSQAPVKRLTWILGKKCRLESRMEIDSSIKICNSKGRQSEWNNWRPSAADESKVESKVHKRESPDSSYQDMQMIDIGHRKTRNEAASLWGHPLQVATGINIIDGVSSDPTDQGAIASRSDDWYACTNQPEIIQTDPEQGRNPN